MLLIDEAPCILLLLNSYQFYIFTAKKMCVIVGSAKNQTREALRMIRVAIVGTGGIAHAHMEAYLTLKERCQVVALLARCFR